MSAHGGCTDQDNEITRRPYSIDLTLELEHQLDSESLPPSSPAEKGRPQSIDTNVLASIITQLRTSLTDVTRERDNLEKSLAEIRAREGDMKDAVANMSDKCFALQDQLDKANERAKEDENTISVLRGKVEESRRGLMKLQSESRRASQVPSPLDISRTSTFAALPISSAKRASFAPLTGSGVNRANSHRRISSVTDASFTRLDGGSSIPSPGIFGFSDSSLQPSKSQISSSRRSSALFEQGSPTMSLRATEDPSEGEILRKEISALKSELDDLRHELGESNEAREASELCVKALRAFIEENNVGVTPTAASGNSSAGRSSLPSLTFMSSQEEPKKSAPAPSAGWAFRLWRAETPARGSAPVPIAPSQTVAPATAMSPSAQSPPPQPLTKKLGDFFGTRASISSMATAPARPLRIEQEPLYSGMSDSSSLEDSVTEPVSPASELPRPVFVRDSISVTSSSLRDLGASPEQKAVGPGSPPAIEGALTPVAL
ncbi:hypothetical protein V8B97DRAFT_1955639 [Scleroderma yunnanense]